MVKNARPWLFFSGSERLARRVFYGSAICGFKADIGPASSDMKSDLGFSQYILPTSNAGSSLQCWRIVAGEL